MLPCCSSDDSVHGEFVYPLESLNDFHGGHPVCGETANFKHVCFGEFAEVATFAAFVPDSFVFQACPISMTNVLSGRNVFEIREPVVGFDAALVVYLKALGVWAKEGQRDKSVNQPSDLHAVFVQGDDVIAAPVILWAEEASHKKSFASVAVNNKSRLATDLALVTNGVESFVAWDGSPFFGGKIDFSHAHLREFGQEPGARSNGSGSAYFSTVAL